MADKEEGRGIPPGRKTAVRQEREPQPTLLRSARSCGWRPEGRRDALLTLGRRDALLTLGGRDALLTLGRRDARPTLGRRDARLTLGRRDACPTFMSRG